MASFNETPGGSRLHIGFFGRTNSGKSSLVNAFAKQEISIVADVAGTTTDPVSKAMELHPLGPCVLIDTAGFDDESGLGEVRVEKTKLAAEKTDLAVLLFSDEDMDVELEWYRYFRQRKIPVVCVVNKSDLRPDTAGIQAQIEQETGEIPVLVSAKTGRGMEEVLEAFIRLIPENHGEKLITGGLVGEGDLVLLVMPQDIQAPKGRLILPQVQTLRELLDLKCQIMCVTAEQLTQALAKLVEPPKLIITDSQVFGEVYQRKPAESMLTSFSVLFAAYKGDISCYVRGAEKLDALTGHSRVLIAECCTHAPLSEDIGRVKIPRMLKKRYGESLEVEIVSGTDFPENVTGYDLIIQCGACMFNRTYVMSRIGRAAGQGVPITNYGVAIAHLTGILDRITMPEC